MNDYTDSAVALLSAAVNRHRTARPDELVEEVWKLYDMAEGFAEALEMLALDEGKFHPYTVRNARIIGVSEDKGLQVSWLEPDRDTGAMIPNDAYIGSLRHAWQRAALHAAKDLAGTEQPCSIYLSYEKQDGYTNSNGQAISWIRRVLRVKPYPAPVTDRPPVERQAAPTAERRPDPRPERQPAPATQAPVTPVEIPTQQTPVDAPPLPPIDPMFAAEVVELLTKEEAADSQAPVRKEVLDGYQQGWWNKLGRDGQRRIRQANDAAREAGRPHVLTIDYPERVGHLKIIANFSRVLASVPA